MNLQKLFELQQGLDKRIKINHRLENQSLLSKKVLALQVQLAELANETRCYKFWSKQVSSNRNIILEELADCLYCILTLGIEKGFTNIYAEEKVSQYDVVSQFLNLYVDINDFVVCSSEDHYITLFEDFLSLAKSLKFSKDEIEKAYYRKSITSNERQKIEY